MTELKLQAKLDNLDKALSFFEEQLEICGCPPKKQIQIIIAAEEIFVNIARYAYPQETGSAELRFEYHEEPERCAVMTFIDCGIPYNPLERSDPDTSLSAEDRSIGGLGIYMVKKSMDEVEYIFRDGKNMLTLKKKL